MKDIPIFIFLFFISLTPTNQFILIFHLSTEILWPSSVHFRLQLDTALMIILVVITKIVPIVSMNMSPIKPMESKFGTPISY